MKKFIRRDETIIAIVTTMVSIAATWYFYLQGSLLAYKDAMSHIMISRRVLENTYQPGFAQLGSVWLPLQHVLTLPFVWNDYLYYSGLGGAVISMVSYVLAVVYVFLTAKQLTNRTGAIIAAVLFGLNLNVLYMQATPMTELLMLLCMIGAVYHFQQWVKSENLLQIVVSAAWACAGTLTRYEGWVIAVLLGVFVLYTGIRKKYPYAKIEAFAIIYGTLAALGIILWLLWGQVIFGDFLSFQRGEYAKPALWVSADDVVVHNMKAAFLTYYYATIHNMGFWQFVVAIMGLLVFMIRDRFKPQTVGVYALLVMFPFFVYMLYGGQRPMKVPEVSNGMYNIRFALVMVLSSSLMTGYLANLKAIRLLAPILTILLFLQPSTIITLADPIEDGQSASSQQVMEAVKWLNAHYDGSFVLSENYGKSEMIFSSHIPLSRHIYEGSYRVWEEAQKHPQDYVDWVFFLSGNGSNDRLWSTVRESKELEEHFRLVYRTVGSLELEIYKKKESTPWNATSMLPQ